MCFSVNVNLVKDELENRYGAEFPDNYKYHPSYYYHAFSFPQIPALCSGSSGKFQLLTWGLIPSWIRSIEDANEIRLKTFNARMETIRSRPSFKKSFESGRCLIPVKGFFEWQHEGKVKIPWYIYHSTEAIFSLAGLSERWVETNTGEVFSTFSVITTDANEMMAVIHNSKKRMPAILEKTDEKKWIDTENSNDDAFSLLKPYPSGMLKAYTIGNLVNNRNADRNTPEVIRPVERSSNSLLF